jgi:hypothetical protein
MAFTSWGLSGFCFLFTPLNIRKDASLMKQPYNFDLTGFTIGN